jgi:hypothetical protein
MRDQSENSMGIGTLQETSLHAALKERLARPGDQFEVAVEGYYIDIVHGDMLIEIQTGNFTALKRKLVRLLDNHRVCVVYPIAAERWVRRVTAEGERVSRRKSPKKGRVEDLFLELVRLPQLVGHPNFMLKALLIQEEVVWQDDGRGSWRRKGWSVADRLLLDVLEYRDFRETADYLALVPDSLEYPFTNNDLRSELAIRANLAQKMTYCLRKMGLIEVIGKDGRSLLYNKIS